MQIKGEFIKRDIAGESFLVPVGESQHRFPGLIALNEVASFVWDRLPSCETEAQIVDALLDEYEVERWEAEADVAELIAKMTEMGLIE